MDGGSDARRLLAARAGAAGGRLTAVPGMAD